MTLEIPGYQIVRVLGKGGMATVYLAVQEIFERQVALKIMSTALAEDPSFGQRFLREARIVSQLAHPNIISVYDVGVHQNAYYLSMEYIAGPDLKQAREQLSLVQKIQIVLDIAQALDFAAGKGYVHRDIKPENILLRKDSLSAVLMDFGIARAAQSDLAVTQTGMALGTPHYMSPEQARGQVVDHRSDLYSLGVVFYYLLMGTVPYHADSAVAIGIKHLTEPVPVLPEPWTPLQSFIDGLMAKLPQDRFQSATELKTALKKVNIRALEKHQRIWREKAPANNADPAALTELHQSLPPMVPTPGNTTQITALERVKSLHWQYKVVAVAAVLTLLAAGVIIGRPFSSDSAAPSKPVVQKPQAEERRAVEAPPPEPDPIDTTEPVPPSNTPVRPITLGDIADREYREVESRPSNAQSRPAEVLQRLRNRLQDVTGRRPTRELTLDEKIAELRTTLKRYPNDLEAQRKLAWLAAQFFTRANLLFNEGDFASAQAALEQSRSLFPEYRTRHEQLADRLKKRERLERLLNQAQVQLAAGKLVSPWRHNALFYFQAALKTDPEVTTAQRGINLVENALMERARAEFAAGDWDRAKDSAEEVLDFRPDSEAARQFLYKLEQYGERDEPAPATPEPELPESISLREGSPVQTPAGSGPNIQQLRVDGKLLSGMNARQLQVVPSQNTLFVSFEYREFPGEKIQLQADLRDAKGKSLMQIPVTITEKKGLNRFRFEQPRQAFEPGEYQLSLALDGQVLIQADFRIE
jgi:predicted Ser/Thr protein kinase/tetratricopeptide (TPR) repeat protein